MNLRTLLLGLAVALCAAPSVSAQTATAWDAPIKVVAIDGSLTKSAGCEGCPDSGAHSATQLTGDGYAEFVPGTNQRLMAGLGRDLSAATDPATIDFAFNIWPGGTWEVRERGVYRADGNSAAGDRFRVAVEGGRVVYRKGGSVVYTSAVTPAFPLALDVTLYSVGASLTHATIVASAGSTTTDPAPAPAPAPPPPGTTAGPVITAVGPYAAVVDRQPYAEPALPVLGAAGSSASDPIFQSTVYRLTDGMTRPGYRNHSYRTTSSPHQNTWSARLSYFFVMSGDGSVIPFTFDQTTGAAQRINPTATGNGGLTLNFYIEPQFSFLNDAVIYGSVAGGNLHTIDQYNFETRVYSRILDLETVVPGLSGTYIGGVGSSAGATERLMAFFGGTSQDRHNYLVVFDKANPANRQIVDTHASTVNGVPTSIPLNFSLHHVAMDHSGRYLMLYTTAGDQASARKAPQSVVWDTQTNTFTELGVAARPYGHDALGYGVSVNQDCCTSTDYDAAQWQFRSLARPLETRDVITNVLTPKVVYMADHPTWNNARADRMTPFISAIYGYGADSAAPRAWNHEIVAVQTDAQPGADAIVWRFAHHRSDVRNDLDPTRSSFWYMPRPNVSSDGGWVLFTSNWEKTLGTDPTGEPGTGARQDVFLVKLKGAEEAGTVTPPPPPPPTVVPVVIDTASLPDGRVAVGYDTSVHATGGSGAYAWSLVGTLPAGLTLDRATGKVAGTPSLVGTFAVTISAADTMDAANSSTAAYAITVDAQPVTPLTITTASLPAGRVSAAYSATLVASGGSGSVTWSVTAGALPAGLALNPATGTISGTPSGAGTYPVTLTVTDAADATKKSSMWYSLVIDAAATSTGPLDITSPRTLPVAKLGVAYTYAVQAVNVTGVQKWSVAGGRLPPGITLNAATGVISGIATTKGNFNFNARIADATSSDTLTLTIQVK